MTLEGCVQHEAVVHNIRRNPADFVQCSMCKKPLLRTNMEIHMKRVHQKALVTGKPASVSKGKSKAKKSELQLSKHETKHGDVARKETTKMKTPSFPCKLCKRPFSKLKALRSHHALKHAETSFAAQKVPCVGAFSQNKKTKFQPLKILKAESIRHSDANVVPTFDCQLCVSKFYSEYSLSTHTRREHPHQVDPTDAKTSTLIRGRQTRRYSVSRGEILV
jgi:hypothetical protein